MSLCLVRPHQNFAFMNNIIVQHIIFITCKIIQYCHQTSMTIKQRKIDSAKPTYFQLGFLITTSFTSEGDGATNICLLIAGSAYEHSFFWKSSENINLRVVHLV